MKKSLLIPTLLTIATSPFISMVSCKEKEPEPEPEPVMPSYDYLYELDGFIKSQYGPGYSYFYSTKESPKSLEKDRTYLFHTDLGIIDEETHDWFFGFMTWYLQVDFVGGALDVDKIDIEVWIDGVKQKKHDAPTRDHGTDDYVVAFGESTQDIELYGYHSFNPPKYQSVFDIFITPHYSIDSLNHVWFRNS